MGNCLITQLKEVVANSNLLKIGEMRVNVTQAVSPSDNDKKIQLFSYQPFTVEIQGDGVLATSPEGLPSSSLKSYTCEGGADVNLWFSNGNYSIIIGPKYNVVNFKCFSITNLFSLNIEDFGYSNIQELDIKGNRNNGNLNKMKCDSLVYLDLGYNTNIVGNIELLPISSIYYASFRDTNVGGSIVHLGYFPSLNTIEMNRNITGSIEDFIDALVSINKSNDIVLNGTSMITVGANNEYYLSSDNARFLEYTSRSNFAIFEGSYTKADAPIIYCKGYSAEQIAAWEQAGKTVYIVN